MQQHNNRGFTLIELMIVVAILALLASIAIPQYQNYVIKSQIARAYSEINTLRTAVEVCEADGEAGGACVSDKVDSDMLLTEPTVTMDPAEISAVLGSNAHVRIQGGTIVLRRPASGSQGWECEMSIPGVQPYFYPSACR